MYYYIDLLILIQCFVYATGFIFSYTSCWPVDDSTSSSQWLYCSYLEYSCQGEFVKHIVLIDSGKFTANCIM